jgi:hypothetical protein
MATIAYLSSGDFSTAVPKKVVAQSITVGTTSYTTVTSSAPLYIPFTPSETGDCKGAVVGLAFLSNETVVPTIQVIVTLQQYAAGAWGDTSSTATATLDTITTGTTHGYTTSTGYAWYYFEFGTMTALTTDASTWRLKVSSSSTSAYFGIAYNTGTVYSHAIVKDQTTTYSANDNIFLKQGITMTVDQDVTITQGAMGIHSIIQWDSTPASSYTFTGTYLWPSRGCELNIGTVDSPIPYAQQAIWNCPFGTRANYQGAQSHFIRMYGEKTNLVKSKLNAQANSGQAKIVLADDCSSVWQAGDTVRVYGSLTASSDYEDRTISSISGAEVTFTANLKYSHGDGFYAVNLTRAIMLGVKISNTVNFGVTAVFKISGVYVAGSISNSYYGGNATDLFETVIFDTVHSSTNPYNTVTVPLVGATITDVTTSNANNYLTPLTISMSVGTNLAATRIISYGSSSITCYSATFSDCHFINAYAKSYNALAITGVTATFTGCRINGGQYGIYGSMINTTFTNCYIDRAYTSGIYISGSTVSTRLNSCYFGNYVANAVDISNGQVFCQLDLNNCLGVTVNGDKLADSLGDSYVKSHTNNQTANNHTSWYRYGKIQSTGDGLADTTVHTSGTGKFATRFEPMSSTDSLTWDISVPTGDISTKTMTVAVWCKINSATYYAGTNQLPRLTIDYDNGTTAYCQAAETTDWQLLFVTFTPTTTYGQITVTLSGRTDATDTDSYIYWDDFAILYPAGYKLDLGGMDLWANAMPIMPPIATVLSANDVWVVPKGSLTGTGTIGKHVKDQLDLNDIILGK